MMHLLTEHGRVARLLDDGTWAYAPTTGSALEMLQSHPISSAVAEAVRGLFDQLGMRVVETGEELTCTHEGDRVQFVRGIDEASVDFVIPMYLFQVERLAGFFEDGVLDDMELFRITEVLFEHGAGPRHLLGNPLVSNPFLRLMIRGKQLLHITLVSPDPAQGPDALWTMVFAAGQWLLVPGHHGTPQRILRADVADAIELQRLLYAGMKAGDFGTWVKVARAYVKWRSGVEVTAS